MYHDEVVEETTTFAWFEFLGRYLRAYEEIDNPVAWNRQCDELVSASHDVFSFIVNRVTHDIPLSALCRSSVSFVG